jgi:CelD/BcsL family acetyltransferase involved in cellulose biosynthesis
MRMRGELITDPARTSEIEEDWRRLAEARGNAFVTPEWFQSWWRQADDSVCSPAIVAVEHRRGGLVGVMPLVVDTSRRPHAIRFAGANLGDRFHPACAVEDETGVARVAMRVLCEEGFEQQLFLLEHVDCEREWWLQMRDASVRRRADHEQQHAEMPLIDLEGLDWDGYLASKSRNFRSQVRRRERALAKEHKLEVRAATRETLERDLATFFDLHSRRWQGRGTSSLHELDAMPLLSDFAAAAERRGWLRLRLLEIDDVPVAAFLGWRLGGTYAFYQSGFDPEWGDSAVGFVMLGTTIRSAIEEGAAQFDMLLGDEDYKQRFANSSRDVCTAVLPRAASATRLLVAGEAGARRLGRRFAQAPAIGNAARSIAGLLPTSRTP